MMFLHNLNRIQFIRSVFFSVILGVCVCVMCGVVHRSSLFQCVDLCVNTSTVCELMFKL